MNSPFPGMDPYLESRWSDVHAKLVTYVGESLQPRLPRSLRARSEERVLVEEEEAPPRGYRADVALVDLGTRDRGTATAVASPTATIEPIVIQFSYGPATDRWIQIIDTTSGNRVVTAIEIISPWNKMPGKLNEGYVKKLEDYRRGAVSVVEIDLLRYPRRGRLLVKDDDIAPDRRTPYMVCIRRAWREWEWQAWPIGLRDRLPAVPIPLRESDNEVMLDLQPLIARVYTAGGHDDIDYGKPADPPLEGSDAVWADSLLKRAGRR